MIAKVLVKQKTSKNEVFDYIVDQNSPTTPLSIVEVPFHNRKMLGIVFEIAEKSEKANKSIIRSLTNGPILTKEQVKIAETIADEFISSTSQALFSCLPNLNLKDLKKINSPIKSKKQINSKQVFVLGSFWQRLNYYIESDDRNSQSLIVVPEISMVEKTSEIYKKISDKKVYVWHSKIKSKQKTKILNSLLAGESITVISTRHGLFLPFTAIYNIFIDQPTSFAQFEDQEPYYNAYKATRLISKIYRANLTIGDTLPDLISFVAIKKKKLALVSLKNKLAVSISGPFGNMLSDLKLNRDLERSKRVLVTGFFKDFYGLSCLECKSSVKCSNCNQTHFNLKNDVCVNCQKQAPLICPICKSARIIQTGTTTHKVKETLSKLTSDVSRFEIRDMAELIELGPNFKLALIPYFDFYSNYPFVTFREKLFRSVLELSDLGVKNVYLFGEDLQNQDFSNQIKRGDWEKFLDDELMRRKNSKMPPFKTTIKIEAKSPDSLKKILAGLGSTEYIINDDNSIYIFVENYKSKDIARALKIKLQGFAKTRIDPVEFA